jgi:signal transduction histidine kinase
VKDDVAALVGGYFRLVRMFRAFSRRRSGPFSPDGLIAVAAFIACELELALSNNIDGPHWVNAVAAAGVTLPVAWRREIPMFAAPLMVAFVAWQELLNGDLIENSITPVITIPLAVYSLGVLLDRNRALGSFAATVLLLFVAVIAADHVDPDTFVFFLLLAGGPFLVGRIVNARIQLARELRAKASRLEQDQAETQKLAVAEERARIAREMHDVVAHNVSVMVVQASAARRMIDHDPTRAREALSSVEQTGREALAEMRRMLDVLRVEDERAALAPQPSIDELEALIDLAREAGLEVELEFEGERRHVSSGVDLSAFRIVQEALSNTIKHAGAAHARVRLRFGDDEVEVDVTDDGHGVRPHSENGTGHGLVGMRERVAMLGGRLEAGYRANGGFEVRATLPLKTEDR